MARPQTRSLYQEWAALPSDQHDLFTIQSGGMSSEQTQELEASDRGDGLAMPGGTRVTPRMWTTPPPRG